MQLFFDLFISSLLYMFRATLSPIIRSTWLYLQLQVLSTDIAAGWYRGWDGTAAKVSPETCRAD
jgi:hypothetical protein